MILALVMLSLSRAAPVKQFEALARCIYRYVDQGARQRPKRVRQGSAYPDYMQSNQWSRGVKRPYVFVIMYRIMYLTLLTLLNIEYALSALFAELY